MSTEQEKSKEIRRIFHLVESTATLAKEATLTGMLKGGEKRCIKQFNNALNRLIEIDIVPEGLFDPLEEEAEFSEVGVACYHLAGFLKSDLDDFEISQKKMDKEKIKKIIVGNIGELKDLGEVIRQAMPKDLGEVIRQSMPDFLKDAWKETKKGDSSKAETPPKSESTPQEVVSIEIEEDEEIINPDSNSVESQIAELRAQIQALAEQLQEDIVSPEEIGRLTREMRKLGKQQAKLAHQRATLGAEESVDDE